SVSAIKRSSLRRTWVVVSFVRFVYSKVPKRWYAFFMVCLCDFDLVWQESQAVAPEIGGNHGTRLCGRMSGPARSLERCYVACGVAFQGRPSPPASRST